MGRIEELATGVFAYIQPDGSWWINNSGFLAAGDHTVLIDTCATEQRTRRLLDKARHTTGTVVTTVVNTHHHGDHTNGNYLTGAATIIGHRNTRQVMITTGIQYYKQAFEGINWGQLRLRPPDVTFDDTLTLHAGDIRVELRYVGRPVHTTGDVLVWLPEQSILFAGDLVVTGTTPFALMGSVRGWRTVLEQIRKLGTRTIIPGHGDAGDAGTIDLVDNYLVFVEQAARAGITAGLTPLQLAQDLNLGEFAGLSDSERIVATLHRAYAELQGRPDNALFDLRLPIRDMINLNGGHRDRCFA
jgi:cyclase